MFKNKVRRLEASVERSDASEKRQPRHLQTVQDVIDLLEEQVGIVRAERWANALEKARAIGYLAGQALRAIETGVLAKRVDMLEMVLRKRKDDEKP